MTSRRSEAYGRVMETLRSVGPTKLLPAEQEVLRDAADTLLFCEDLDASPEGRAALESVVALTRQLVDNDRWLPDSADRLVEDVAACGPVVLV